MTNTLNISDETMKEIKQYLLKTSMPRIIEKQRRESNANEKESDQHAKNTDQMDVRQR